MTDILQVDLGARSYPIYIGAGLIGQRELYARHIVGRQAVVITNEVVAPLYLEPVRAALAGHAVEVLVLPDGEATKTLATADRMFDFLLAHRIDRRATLVALGGGVIGDLVGFAAACYQRGIEFIQVPTTLLAQVDSSVGGKTGVNHPRGKNMIGAFHQPRAVIADTTTLDTLDDRQLSAGLAEVIKYGLIRDVGLHQWLSSHMVALLARDPAALAHAIRRSCEIKAEIVGRDERESGERALLNLGHTFGHALETALGYGAWLHGEAVGAGMHLAAELSRRLGWIGAAELADIDALLARARLPLAIPPGQTPDGLRALMAVDKKVLDGRLRLVLLKAIGTAVVTDDYAPDQLEATLRAACTAPVGG